MLEQTAQRNELLTLPTAVTVAGFAMALRGANEIDTTRGAVVTTLGRLCDLADGKIARMTGQTSEFGAHLDATLDKFASLAILSAEWQKNIAPKTALAAIFAQNAVNGAATYVAARRGTEVLEPSRDGKLAMATQNLALGAYAVGNLLKQDHPKTATSCRFLGHLAATAGVGHFGRKATVDYIRRARA